MSISPEKLLGYLNCHWFKWYKPLAACTTTFTTAFVVSMLLVATHSYSPLSAGFRFFIVRLPLFTSVLPTGNGIHNLVQLNTGGGNPLAWQVSLKVECSFGAVSVDGTGVKMGRPRKIPKLANARLTGNLAWHFIYSWSLMFSWQPCHDRHIFRDFLIYLCNTC